MASCRIDVGKAIRLLFVMIGETSLEEDPSTMPFVLALCHVWLVQGNVEACFQKTAEV
jgi:hypothetical protein